MTYLWSGMLLIGIVYGVLSGNVDEITGAFVSCSGEAVSLCISMAGITAMWTGMMKIAENSGLVSELAVKMRPLIRFLFPKLDTESKAVHYICLNFLSNVIVVGKHKFGPVCDEGTERTAVTERKCREEYRRQWKEGCSQKQQHDCQ